MADFGGTDPTSNYLSFELRGDGAVPSVSLQASFVMASVEDIFEEGWKLLLFWHISVSGYIFFCVNNQTDCLTMNLPNL